MDGKCPAQVMGYGVYAGCWPVFLGYTHMEQSKSVLLGLYYGL